ncbi:MAG: hypothetical protein H6774_03755 [Pseudomonadales bacterium]|nr:hypothetical protein [Candidatus Woesebacteria bacterium]MCB9802177.1 hypothetical protein [Pseudomonadales bacterium]
MLSFFSQNKHLFWSADITKLDLQEHKQYIIHQVLQYGDLETIRMLKQVYSHNELVTTFVEHPRKTYQAKTFSFVKKHVLGITSPLDESNYVSVIS